MLHPSLRRWQLVYLLPYYYCRVLLSDSRFLHYERLEVTGLPSLAGSEPEVVHIFFKRSKVCIVLHPTVYCPLQHHAAWWLAVFCISCHWGPLFSQLVRLLFWDGLQPGGLCVSYTHIRHPLGSSMLVQASIEVTVLDAWTYDNQAVLLNRCASRSLSFTWSCLWVFLCTLSTFTGRLGWNLHWSNWPSINSLNNTDRHFHVWITFYILSWFIISKCHLSQVPDSSFAFSLSPYAGNLFRDKELTN